MKPTPAGRSSSARTQRTSCRAAGRRRQLGPSAVAHGLATCVVAPRVEATARAALRRAAGPGPGSPTSRRPPTRLRDRRRAGPAVYGCRRSNEELVDRRRLDDLAARTSRRPGRRSRRSTPRSWLMNRIAMPVSCLDLAQQVEDAPAPSRRGRSSARRRSSSSGSHDEGHGDHHPLAHPAAEHVRVVVARSAGVGDAHPIEQLDGPSPGLRRGEAAVAADRLGDLLADGERRVEAARSAAGRSCRSAGRGCRSHSRSSDSVSSPAVEADATRR